MLSGILNKSIQCDTTLINDFSRFAPVINKLNGTTNKQEANVGMSDKKRSKHDYPDSKSSDNFGGNFRPVPSHISTGIPHQWRRAEESIFVANTSVAQHTNFPVGVPYWQAVYNYAYSQGNFSQTVFPPHLNQQYFHRPNQENQRQAFSGHKDTDNVEKLRFWEQMPERPRKSGFNFTLMSYNVLAQDLVQQHPYLYSLHKKEFLNWDVRWNNLLAEIQQFKPEILCLQEVQGSHLKTHFSALETLGYRYLYKQRTGIRTDGCAIFYKHPVLNLMEYTTVEYKQPGVCLLDRDNVAIIAKFSPKKKEKEFVVATTHLLYNPRRQDVRLAQIQLLLTEVDRLAFKREEYLPVILTGDLNSSPNSAVYRLITKGKLKYENLQTRSLKSHDDPRTGKIFLPPSLRITDQCQHADILQKRESNKTLSRSEELELIKLTNSERQQTETKRRNHDNEKSLFSTGTLTHNLSLKSVYDDGKKGDMEGTTFQDEWVCVDYIFFSQRNLRLMERYRLPTDKELGDVKIPNARLGSDHLSLLAKFHL